MEIDTLHELQAKNKEKEAKKVTEITWLFLPNKGRHPKMEDLSVVQEKLGYLRKEGGKRVSSENFE